MSYGSTARAVRGNKERHPERYCSAPNCLWRISDTPCPKHEVEVIRWARTLAAEWWNGARLEDRTPSERRDAYVEARAHVQQEKQMEARS